MKWIIALMLLTLVLLSSSIIPAQDDIPIIDINSTYYKYGYYPETSTFIAHDGLRYKFTQSGAIKIYDQAERFVGGYGLAMTGIVGGNNYLITEDIFNWEWEVSNETVMEDGFEWNGTDVINVTYRYTKYTVKGINNYSKFPIEQYFEFTPHKDVKIRQILTNNLVAIQNTKLWYVNTLNNAKGVIWNGTLYKPDIDNIHLQGNFNNILPRLQFVGAHTFDYSDIVESGFDITDIRVGSGDIIGKPNLKLLAVGISKDSGVFPKGVTIELDPESTGFKFPTGYGDPLDEWTSSNNLLADDANYAYVGLSPGELENVVDTDTYNFDIPDSATITGIAAKIECLPSSIFFPCSATVGLNTTISWDGGTSWSDSYGSEGDKYFYFFKCILQTKTKGDSTDMWGASSWIVSDFNNTNFRLRTQFSYADSGYPRVDYVQVNVYYELPIPNVTFISPTPADSSNPSSTWTVNVSSNVTLDHAKVHSNHTGTWINYTLTEENSTIFSRTFTSYDEGADNNTDFQFQVFGYVTDNETQYYNYTEIREVVTESAEPAVTLNSPTNDSTAPELYRMLNWSISDSDSDYMDVFVYGGNSTDTLNNNLIYRSYEELDCTLTYNWTHIPIDKAHYDDVWVMFHMDNNILIGENSTYLVDSISRANGTHKKEQNNYPELRDGFVGKGYYFWEENHQGNSIEVGDNTTFNSVCDSATGCTFCIWANMTAHESSAFFGEWTGTESRAHYMLFYSGSTNKTDFRIDPDGDTAGGESTCYVFSPANNLSLNEWHHLCGVYNNSDALLYMDGNLVGNTTCAFTHIYEVNWSDDDITTEIGDAESGGADFNGELDEFVAWNRSFNSAEIKAIYDDYFMQDEETYYWEARAYDSPSGYGNQSWLFTIGTEACSCTSASCIVDCALNCVFSDAIDLSGTDIDASGAGSATWQNDVTNSGNISVYDGCFASFLGRLET